MCILSKLEDTSTSFKPCFNEIEGTCSSSLRRSVKLHAYLICVQVWSISYNSWLTLILLVWSCVIWMLKDRRRFAMLSAPFLAVYGTFLLVITFISQLHLNHIDIFPTLPKLVLIDFDVYGYPVPCVHLAAKV